MNPASESWLAEIQKLVSRTTPGPWQLHIIQPDMSGRNQYMLRREGDYLPDGVVLNSTRIKAGDAEFIARARTFVPEMCMALYGAWHELAELRHRIEGLEK